MTAALTGVTSAEIVTLRTKNINGDGQPHGNVMFGFLRVTPTLIVWLANPIRHSFKVS